MSDQTLGERLAEKIVRMTGQHYFGSLIGGMSGLASLIDTDEEVKRLTALEREADNRDEMEAMIAQRYCEHIKLLDAKVERVVADKPQGEKTPTNTTGDTLGEKERMESALLRIFDWARCNRPYAVQCPIEGNTLLQDICEQGLGYWPPNRIPSMQPVDKTGTEKSLGDKALPLGQQPEDSDSLNALREKSWPTSEEWDKAVEDYKACSRMLGMLNVEELGKAFSDGAGWMFRNRPQSSLQSSASTRPEEGRSPKSVTSTSAGLEEKHYRELMKHVTANAARHPQYGPCDGLGKDGSCSECDRLSAQPTKPEEGE